MDLRLDGKVAFVTGASKGIGRGIAGVFARHGAKVLVDGAQAISHLRVDVQAYDCDFYVFSGHKLYGPTGIGVLYGRRELLEEIKHDEQLRSIPVVVLTASRIHEEILRAEHLQVESYITKPVALEKFLKVVRDLRQYWLADMIVPSA